MFGEIETTITALFGHLLRAGETFFDVGSNFGYFALLGAKRVGEGGADGKVYAFEPDPRNLARLRRNVARNGLRQVEVVPLGLFDSRRVMRFHLAAEAEDNLGTSSLVDAGAGRATMEIAVTSLDEYLRGTAVTRIDLLKMDIEGAEGAAIAGAAETLRSGKVKYLLLELHQAILGEERLRQVLRAMGEAGYRAYYIDEDKHKRRPAGARLADFLTPAAGDGGPE